MKRLVTILIAVFFVNSIAIAMPPSSTVCNVPITLTNAQNTATPDSFEQMVTVNSSLFSSLEMSGLENIEFTVGAPAPTGTVLQAWIESGNSSSSTSTVYWVNLGNNIIPADSSLIIYMNFMSSAVLSATGPTGEAPDISGTYAQYDNGGLVFPHVYTRWGGLSGGTLPTTTNGDAINAGNITSVNQTGTMTITNQTNYTQVAWNNPSSNTSYPGNINGVYYATTPASSYTYPTVLESKADVGSSYSWFGTGYGQEEEGWGAIIANDNDDGPEPYYTVRSNWNFGNSCSSGQYSYQNWSALNESNPAVEVWTILLNNVNDTDQITSVLYDYTKIPGQTFPLPIDGNGTLVYQAPCNGGLGTLFGYFGTTQNYPNPQPYEQMYWTRTRAFPPNGVMPTATVGDTTAIGTFALISPLDTTICAGASVTLSAIGGLSYTWSNSDTGSVITVTPATTSVFIVTATNGCGTGSDTAVVTVDTNAQVLTILPLDPVFCSGQNVTLYVSYGGFSFSWSPSASLSDSVGDSVVATPLVTTTYVVTGTDSLGCAATGTDKVTVVPSPNKPSFYQHGDTLISSSEHDNQWYYDNISSGADTSQFLIITDTGEYWVVVYNEANGCGTSSDTTVVTQVTGINQLSITSKQLSVYPNPFSNQLTVISKQLPIDEIDVVNELGQAIFVFTGNLGNKNTIDLSNLPSGMYFITVINKTGRTVVPVVKQ